MTMLNIAKDALSKGLHVSFGLEDDDEEDQRRDPADYDESCARSERASGSSPVSSKSVFTK